MGLFCSCVTLEDSGSIPENEIVFYVFVLVRTGGEFLDSLSDSLAGLHFARIAIQQERPCPQHEGLSHEECETSAKQTLMTRASPIIGLGSSGECGEWHMCFGHRGFISAPRHYVRRPFESQKHMHREKQLRQEKKTIDTSFCGDAAAVIARGLLGIVASFVGDGMEPSKLA